MSQNEVIIKLIADSKGLTGGMKTASQQVNTFSQNIAQLAQGTLKLSNVQKQARNAQGQFAKGNVTTTHLINQAKAAVARLREEKQRMAQIDEVLTKALGKQDAALLKNTGLMQGFAGGAGSASFALLSLTQGVQDAGQFSMGMAQGIRAVNNNVQQFATALMFASAQMGGLSKAIKGMWVALSGPAGILFAFSIVTVAIESFSNRAQRAKKEVKELASGFSELAEVVPTNPMRKFLITQRELEKRLAATREELEGIKGAGIESIFGQSFSKLTEDQAAKVELLTANISAMEEVLAGIKTAGEEYANFLGTTAGLDALSTLRMQEFTEKIAELKAELKLSGEFSDFEDEIAKLQNVLKSGIGFDIKDPDEAIEEFERRYNAFLGRLRKGNPGVSATAGEFAKLGISAEEFAKKMADGTLEEFLREERWKVTSAHIKKVRGDLQKLDAVANKFGAGAEAMPVETIGSIAQAIERQKALIEGGVVTSTGELRKDALADMQIGSDMLRMMSDETQSEMVAMAVATEEANRSMGNSFSAWWRKNGEAVDASAKLMSRSIGGVGTAFMQIANRSDGGNEKLFNAGKKFAIASALINTYTGITAALATPNVGPVTRFALAAAVGAQGFAQVAAIRSTTMSGGGGGSSKSGGASGVGAAPTFFTGFSNVSDIGGSSASLGQPGAFGNSGTNIRLVAEGRDLVGVMENHYDARSRVVGGGSVMLGSATQLSGGGGGFFDRQAKVK